MISYTTGELGKGWVYGLNTALDEVGATIGPLVIAAVLVLNGSYRLGYLLLLIPIWSTTIHFCDAHEGEVSTLTARLARWVCNLLWGVRYARVRARPGQPGALLDPG